MLTITEEKHIHITRGDIATLDICIKQQDGSYYTFAIKDVVRLTVVAKNNYNEILIQKDVEVEAETEVVSILLNKEDTRFAQNVSKPVDYWYEIELNPETAPQTIIGHDEDGAKIFRIYPEGGNH